MGEQRPGGSGFHINELADEDVRRLAVLPQEEVAAQWSAVQERMSAVRTISLPVDDTRPMTELPPVPLRAPAYKAAVEELGSSDTAGAAAIEGSVDGDIFQVPLGVSEDSAKEPFDTDAALPEVVETGHEAENTAEGEEDDKASEDEKVIVSVPYESEPNLPVLAEDELDRIKEFTAFAPENHRPALGLIIGSVMAARDVQARTYGMPMGSLRMQKADADLVVLERQAVAAEWVLDPRRPLRQTVANGIAARNLAVNPKTDFESTLQPADTIEPLRFGIEKELPQLLPFLSFIRKSLVAARKLQTELHLPLNGILTDDRRGLTVSTKGYWMKDTEAKVFKAQAAAVGFAVDTVYDAVLEPLRDQWEANSVFGMLYADMAESSKDRKIAGDTESLRSSDVAALLPPARRYRKAVLRAEASDFLQIDPSTYGRPNVLGRLLVKLQSAKQSAADEDPAASSDSPDTEV